jgi:hypothetical protein
MLFERPLVAGDGGGCQACDPALQILLNNLVEKQTAFRDFFAFNKFVKVLFSYGEILTA